MLPFTVSQVLLALFLYLLYYFIKNIKYWKSRHLPHTKFVPIIGDCSPILKDEKDFGALVNEIHDLAKRNDSHAGGFWLFDKPSAVLRDPDHIHKMLVKQFEMYNERVQYFHKEKDAHFGELRYQNISKDMRQSICDKFSERSVEKFFVQILRNAEKLAEHIRQSGDQGVNIFEECIRYTDNNVDVCFSGQDGQSSKHKNEINGHKYDSIWKKIEMAANFIIPETIIGFGCELLSGKAGEAVDDILTVSKDENGDENVKSTDKYNTDSILSSFKSSFNAISASIAFTLYYLASDIKTQEKLKQEISNAKLKNGGNLTYDVIKEMSYLDMIYKETLRLHPVIPYLDRRCTRTNRLGTGLFVTKGDRLFVSIEGAHLDSQYWTNPESFNPERFSPENAKHNPKSYIPFGLGPRACIGEQLAIFQSKIAIIAVLSNFTIKSTSDLSTNSNQNLLEKLKLKCVKSV